MGRGKLPGDAVDDPACRQMEVRIAGYYDYVDYDVDDDDPRTADAQPRHRQRRPRAVAATHRMGCRSERKGESRQRHRWKTPVPQQRPIYVDQFDLVAIEARRGDTRSLSPFVSCLRLFCFGTMH